MAKAREVAGFADSASFREAAIRAVRVRAEEVFDHRDGVLDMTDIERVHDMRVATRRLRAAMEIFAPCFPKKQHRKLLKEVKALADVLGERRDADVAIAALERVSEAMPVADRPGVSHLVAELRDEQEAANAKLAEALDGIEADALEERLMAFTVAAARDQGVLA